MNVRTIDDAQALAPLEVTWNALSGGVPFLSWDWLATWWHVYADAHTTLHVCVVSDDTDDERAVAIAPFYVRQSAAKGRVVRLLGDGEVCTDHVSILTQPGRVNEVAAALADHFTASNDEWDAVELASVDTGDVAIDAFVAALADRECDVAQRPADACWTIDLPDTWDEYLAQQSKSHRKQLRRAERRVLESDRVKWHPVQSPDEFEQAWEVFVDLHQRRRQSLGEPGCFASKQFHEFHYQVAQRLLARDQLRLSWLELDGTPAAAEYHFAGPNSIYAYQGGVDPDRLDDEPGRLSTIMCLRAAMDEGLTKFDFLRGDEPYKAHWRAVPQSTTDIRVTPNRRLAQLRGRVMNVAGAMADWLRTGAQHVTNGTGGGA